MYLAANLSNLLNLIPIALLFVLGIFARQQIGSWLAPSTFFAVYWSILLFFALLLAPDIAYWSGTGWIILLLAYALHIGTAIGASKISAAHRLRRLPTVRINFAYGRAILIFGTLVGLVGAIVLIARLGLGVLTLLQPTNLVAVGTQYAILRYAYGQGNPLLVNMLNMFLYAACSFAGIWAVLQPSWKVRAWVILPLASGFLQSILINSRMHFIWLFVFFAGSLLATLVLTRQYLSWIRVYHFLWAPIVTALLAIFYAVLQVFRNPLQELSLALLKAQAVFIGPPYLLSQWLEVEWATLTPAWGTQTFGGVAQLLGVDTRAPGLGWLQTDFVLYGYSMSVNVHTLFRQILEDFTLPGAIIFFLLLGIVIGQAYRRVEDGSVLWLPLLMLFYAVTLSSYISNWMTYNTCLFGWLIFSVSLLLLNSKLVYSEKTQDADWSLPVRDQFTEGARL